MLAASQADEDLRLNLRPVLERVRTATDVAGVCPEGHGGHQLDAKFCRICGSELSNPRGAMMERHDTKDASWTDDDDENVRAALMQLGLPSGGNRKTIITRLIEADKPEGWKWEG